MVKLIWDEASRSGDPPKGAEAWLLMAESLEVWDRMGPGPGWDRLRDLFRAKEQMREHLFPSEALSDQAARAERGYLAWRRDLVLAPARPRGGAFYRSSMPFFSGCSWPHSVHRASHSPSSTNVARFSHFGQKIRNQLLTIADMTTSRRPFSNLRAGDAVRLETRETCVSPGLASAASVWSSAGDIGR